MKKILSILRYHSAIFLLLSVFIACLNSNYVSAGEIPDYAPGSLIIKFALIVKEKNFTIRVEQNIVKTNISSIDSLSAKYNASSFKPFFFRLLNDKDIELGRDRMYVFQFPSSSDMRMIAKEYAKDENVEYAHPNYLFSTEIIEVPQDFFFDEAGNQIFMESVDTVYVLRFDSTLSWKEIVEKVHYSGIDTFYHFLSVSDYMNPKEMESIPVYLPCSSSKFKILEIPDSLKTKVQALKDSTWVIYLRNGYIGTGLLRDKRMMDFFTNRIAVKFHETTSRTAIDSILNIFKLSIIIDQMAPVYLLELPWDKSSSELDICKKLHEFPEVQYAQPDEFVRLATDIKEDKHELIPDNFQLYPSYPNPFNPTATISFDLPKASSVMITIYNVLGQKVATLINGKLPAGRHERVWNAARFSSGIYFVRMQAGDFVKTTKITLLK